MKLRRQRVKLGGVEFTTLIGPESLAAAFGGRHLVVLDCRFDLNAPEAGRIAYRASRIPTARYADLNRDLAGPVEPDSGRHPLPDPARLAGRLRGFGITDESQVVVYDDGNAMFAARAWWLLRWLGLKRIAVLDGGFKGWIEMGGPLENFLPKTGPPSATHRTAPLPDGQEHAIHVGSVVETGELVQLLKDSRHLLVDARAPERFAGEVEPLDPVAGHVPGAVNHPFALNIGADGRFLPPAELRRRWQERLFGTAPADVVVMCGSGVTACHNLLALEIAGLPGARLYAGSWSEWIRDPARPVARGTAA